MNVSVDDLAKALAWIKNNSMDVYVKASIIDGKLYFKCKDKYESQVEITIFGDSTLMPKIRKEDIL